MLKNKKTLFVCEQAIEPLSETMEGQLVGGFTALNYFSTAADNNDCAHKACENGNCKNANCSNPNCKNGDCSNEGCLHGECTNPGCNNPECTDPGCPTEPSTAATNSFSFGLF